MDLLARLDNVGVVDRLLLSFGGIVWKLDAYVELRDGKFKAGDGGEIPHVLQDGGVVQGSNDQMHLDAHAINGNTISAELFDQSMNGVSFSIDVGGVVVIVVQLGSRVFARRGEGESYVLRSDRVIPVRSEAVARSSLRRERRVIPYV